MRLATAGLVSAAVLSAPGCGSGPAPAKRDGAVERASFRSLAARQFLATCPGGASRPETLEQEARLEALKGLAAGKDLDHAVWVGENRWNGLARYSDREPCRPGEPAYRDALAAFSGALDALAQTIAEAPQ
ncbi:hypothetical protein [Sphingosinicella terrae]|uniref:hypothetical protein n=1 Tax=Sphingosinicella terrae TaxID=2172047 RepID=UPI000E0CC07A|nr:hypothetical protein [Sphingosinicella terrae]